MDGKPSGPGENRPLFSLIMCLHGVESHVATAVESVRAQTCVDWELLLVDDAVTDKSVRRALRAAHSDPRIRFIHHRANEGLSASRNDGLEHARGRFVCFPDAEDTLEPWFLDSAAAAIADYDPDIVLQGVVDDHYNRAGEVRYSTERMPPDAVALTSQAVRDLVMPIEEVGLVSYVYPYAFRRELFGEYRFADDGRHGEDFYLTLALLEKATSLVSMAKPAYHYAHHFRDRVARIYDPDAFRIRQHKVERLQRFLDDHGLASPKMRASLGAVYAADVVDALVSLTEYQPDVTRQGRLRWVAELLEDPLFDEMVDCADGGSNHLLNGYIKVLRTRKPNLLLSLGRSVGYLRSFGPQNLSRTQF